jgi:hypothetical protein
MVVAASIGALALPCTALATGGDQLEQTCVKAALKKPKIVKAAVKHAGRYAGRDQNVVLVAKYEAMPEECRDGYHRGNSAKAQVLSHGNWTYITNWLGLWGAPIRYEGDHSVVEDQGAFTGRFEGLPFSHLTPRRFDPCRVRVLLKENVAHPEHHEYPDSGYHPPDFSNNIAHRIYKVNVPVSHVWPHRGTACNLLVPENGRDLTAVASRPVHRSPMQTSQQGCISDLGVPRRFPAWSVGNRETHRPNRANPLRC